MALLKLVLEKRPIQPGETPEGFFDHLRGEYAFLLSSGSRYSFIGYDPFLIAECQNDTVYLQQRRDFFHLKKTPKRRVVDGDPTSVLRDLLKEFAYKGSAPVPFIGGAVGYFTYDFGSRFVGVKQEVFDDQHLSPFVFCFVDKVIAFDHQAGTIFFLGLAETDLAAKKKVDQLQEDLQRPSRLVRSGEMSELVSNVSQTQYLEKVQKVQDYLRRGESYQVNFSQRFSARCTLDPWAVFKKLSVENPSPFSCYLQYPDFSIVSSSPELLMRKRGSHLETWPIKGTVKRGGNVSEDERLAAELLASSKDDAELSMIVDLERNDLGRVSKVGSVKVAGHREIQKLAHVIHTVSKVESEIDPKKDVVDVVEALFPGGSITGCPKKRTMEIIDKLEDFKRGIYTGSAGYFSFNGDADLNILIRTLLFQDEGVFFQVGGGITIDSDPLKEYEETLHKAESLRLALFPESSGTMEKL